MIDSAETDNEISAIKPDIQRDFFKTSNSILKYQKMFTKFFTM